MSRLPHHPLVVLLTAAVTGICVDRWTAMGQWGYLLAACHLLGWADLRRRRHVGAVVPLWCAVACVLAAWHHQQWRVLPPDHVATFVWQSDRPLPAVIRGVVRSCPLSRPASASNPLATVPSQPSTTFLLDVQKIRDGSHWRSASGRIRVRVHDRLRRLAVGQRLELMGDLRSPSRTRNPGERNLRDAARTRRLLAQLEVAEGESVRTLDKTRSWWMGPESWRRSGLDVLDRYLGTPGGRLAGALLLGARERLTPDRVRPFYLTGTAHLLSISGLHVGILAGLFLFLARRVVAWPQLAVGCLMVALIVYVQVAGGRAPVLRAATLIQLVACSLLLRRRIRPYNGLAAAGLLILLWSPAELFRPGTQLSFLAVWGLIWCQNHPGRDSSAVSADPLDRLLARHRPWCRRAFTAVKRHAAQLTWMGCVVWMFTLPVVLYTFHIFAPVGILLNLLLSIPLTLALVSGLAVLLTAGICPPCAEWAGGFCGTSLAWMEWLVEHAAQIPGAYAWVAGPSGTSCVLYYLGLVWGAYGRVPQLRRWWVLVGWHACWLMGVLFWPRSLPHDELRCCFLAVGHGGSFVLELPSGEVVLVDAGRLGWPEQAVTQISAYLWSRRIEHLDAVILSHGDADHYNAVPGLLARFSIGRIHVAPRMERDRAPGIRALRAAMKQAGVPYSPLHAGNHLPLRDHQGTLKVLHPAGDVGGSDNANSLVLELEFAGRRLILPGDLEPPGLQPLFAAGKRNADVLLAPHHGSLRSEPATMWAWCSPEVVVISAGLRRAEPSSGADAYWAAGARNVFHTAVDGAVTIRMTSDAMHLRTGP